MPLQSRRISTARKVMQAGAPKRLGMVRARTPSVLVLFGRFSLLCIHKATACNLYGVVSISTRAQLCVQACPAGPVQQGIIHLTSHRHLVTVTAFDHSVDIRGRKLHGYNSVA
jgi:hypothetical protein